MSGVVPDTDIGWYEACSARLDYRLDTLWVLLEPRILLTLPDGTSADHIELAKEYVREQRAVRRNKRANELLSAWLTLLLGSDNDIALQAFGISTGIDAEFSVQKVTAFSGTSHG